MNLAADDRADGVTTPVRTVIDCARRLPFDEALPIADSALRSGLVTREELDVVQVRGAGAGSVRRVLRHADGRAANPFESVLRARAIEVGLDVEPQVALDLGSGVVHPDLTDRSRHMVLEADSWSHQATRSGHKSDCARYNLLVLCSWRVFRFSWEQVMLEPSYVRWVLDQVRRVERPELGGVLRRTA
jgi:very-short-patch-repair endonuclease